MDMEQEQQKLAQVNDEILAQINKYSEGLRTRQEGVLEARRLMYKATHVVRDFDDVVLLTMYAQEVSATEIAYGETSKMLTRLQRILDTPYFARIDFVEEGYDDREEIYIGRHSLFDETTQTFHVYDWRAPISSLYYDFGVGRASFAVPVKDSPDIAGDIVLKRHYQIEKGKLVYFFDSDLAVEDDMLRRELSKVSDAKIKTIIHSIQREQNRAIRAEAGSVLVFGPAGSGKTSVGLHRLAYLLYHQRNTLASSKVRIFSPSAVFASYIEGIIPDLGEDEVTHMDFAQLVETLLKRPFHDGYELIEYLLAAQHEPAHTPRAHRRAWLAHKYSTDFLDHVEKTVRTHAPAFDDIFFYRDKICDRRRLADLYADRTSASTLAGKTARVIDYVQQCFAGYYRQHKKAITALFESIADDTLTDEEARLRYEEEKNIVLIDLRNRLSPTPQKLYQRALKSYPPAKTTPMRYIHESLHQEKLYFEDALALVYIGVLTGRIAADTAIKHILLDEAQDAPHIAHRLLRKLYPASQFTILADPRQALYDDINLHHQADIEAQYPNAQVIPLTKSYRSTFEINRFANQFLPDEFKTADDSALYMRHGDEPQVITLAENACVYDATREILASLPADYQTIGILLPNARQARDFFGKLNHAPAKLIADADQQFAPGVMVMAVPYAKGLEFDAVICPLSNYEMKNARTMYLICTRALHQLHVISGFTGF